MIGKVGRKTLRLYEENGLLIPNLKREDNGYRYYSKEQIGELHCIKEYKKFGLSLKEIKQIIRGEVYERETLEKHKTQLEHEIQTKISVKTQLEMHLNDNNIEGFEPYVMEMKIFEQKTVLFIQEDIELEHLGMSVGKLHELAVKSNLILTGSHYAKYDNAFTVDDDFTMETCLP